MSKEPGPRERALREMREARANLQTARDVGALRNAIKAASKKRGKPRKAKK